MIFISRPIFPMIQPSRKELQDSFFISQVHSFVKSFIIKFNTLKNPLELLYYIDLYLHVY